MRYGIAFEYIPDTFKDNDIYDKCDTALHDALVASGFAQHIYDNLYCTNDTEDSLKAIIRIKENIQTIMGEYVKYLSSVYVFQADMLTDVTEKIKEHN